MLPRKEARSVLVDAARSKNFKPGLIPAVARPFDDNPEGHSRSWIVTTGIDHNITTPARSSRTACKGESRAWCKHDMTWSELGGWFCCAVQVHPDSTQVVLQYPRCDCLGIAMAILQLLMSGREAVIATFSGIPRQILQCTLSK